MDGLTALGVPLLRRSVIDDVTGKPVITSPPTGEVVSRSNLLPLGITDEGRMTVALPQAVLGAYDAARFPGQVLRGEKGVFDLATGHVSQEAMDAANGIAGIAMTGSLPFSAPSGALRMFGGRNAATADHAALKEAEWHYRNGADREHIWDATGWFKAPDGNWKFEIPDELSTLGTPKNAPPGYGQLHHDDLAQAYPDLWARTQQSIKESPVANGRYEAGDNVIHAQGPTTADQHSIALHELQHAIQREEGFSRGANPRSFTPSDWEAAGAPVGPGQTYAAAHDKWAWDQYHRTAGEVEARNVQARMNMTPEQRFNTPPWLTQDVADADQIVRLGGGGPQMSLGGMAAQHADDPLAALEAALGNAKPNSLNDKPFTFVDPKAKQWDLYHGTNAATDFDKFRTDLPHVPRDTKSALGEAGAVFLTPSAAEAEHYAGDIAATAANGYGYRGGDAGPRVIRTTVDPGKTELIDIPRLYETDPGFVERARQAYFADNGGDTPITRQLFDTHHAQVMDDIRMARETEPMAQAMGFDALPPKVKYGYGATSAAVQMAKERGLDTAVLRGLNESNGGDQVIALTPGRVRSYYTPDQLLYSGGPGGALAALGMAPMNSGNR